MKQSIRISAGISIITAIIGIVLWLNGYPPEKEGLSQAAQQLRSIMTFPLFWSGSGLALGLLYIWFKRGRLAEAEGKTAKIPTLAVQFPVLFALLFQILIPLDLYGIMEASGGGQIALFYFMSAFFLVMGNYVTTAKFGSRVGFRTSATLSDAKIWTRIHRSLGRNLVLIVLVASPLPWLMEPKIALWTMFGMIVCNKAVMWEYARRLNAQMQATKQPVPAAR